MSFFWWNYGFFKFENVFWCSWYVLLYLLMFECFYETQCKILYMNIFKLIFLQHFQIFFVRNDGGATPDFLFLSCSYGIGTYLIVQSVRNTLSKSWEEMSLLVWKGVFMARLLLHYNARPNVLFDTFNHIRELNLRESD